MKFKLIYTLLFCSILTFGCSDEKSNEDTPSVEKMSLKVEEAAEKTDKSTENNEEQVKENINTDDAKEEAATTPANSNQGQAVINFAEESYFFGEIEEGDLVKHTFKFKNDGNATLVIKDATATCGCTRPDFPFVPIQPGETGDINVVFNSTGKVGPQKKAVTVYSNGQPRVKKVYLEGTVLAKKKEEVSAPDIQEDTTTN